MNEQYGIGVYNTYKNVSKLPYLIFNALVDNNDSIFKLLTFDEVEIEDYEDCDGYQKEMQIIGDNLNKKEKMDLLYKGGNHAEKYRIQLMRNTDDALPESQCRLHISLGNPAITPVEAFRGRVNIRFEVICHNKYNMIDEGRRSRVDCICEELINTLSHIHLGGCISDVFFNYQQSRSENYLKSDISNTNNFIGNTLQMSVWYGQLENKRELR